MSQLNVDTIRSADGTDDTLDIGGQNTVKVFCSFNGTGTIAIDDSFNVASLTDNGTGDYDINYTTSFADTTYSAFVHAKKTAGDASAQWAPGVNKFAAKLEIDRTTGQNTTSAAAVDNDVVMAICVGNQ